MHQPQVGAFFNGGLSSGDENRATRPQAGEKQSGGLFFSPWVESHRFRHQAEPGSPLPLRSVLIRSPLGSRPEIGVPGSVFCLFAGVQVGIYIHNHHLSVPVTIRFLLFALKEAWNTLYDIFTTPVSGITKTAPARIFLRMGAVCIDRFVDLVALSNGLPVNSLKKQ